MTRGICGAQFAPPSSSPPFFLFYFFALTNDRDHILMPGFPFLVPPPLFFNDFVNEEQEGGDKEAMKMPKD